MSIYTYSFLGYCSSSLICLLSLLTSLKVICSCKVPVSFFFWTAPSLTPLPYIFGAEIREVEVPSHSPQPVLQSVEAWQAHFPTQAFKISSRGCAVPLWAVQVLCKGCIGFPHNPKNIGLFISLSLSSSFLYTFFSTRPTNTRTEAFCHSTTLHATLHSSQPLN